MATAILRGVVNSWRQIFDNWRSVHTVDAGSIACTLAFALLDENSISIRSVGDSLCFIRSRSDGLHPILVPTRLQGGGVLTLADSPGVIASNAEGVDLWDPESKLVAVCTDGVERVVRRKQFADADGQQRRIIDAIDPAFDHVLGRYQETREVGAMIESLRTGLVAVRGAKGDDIGIAIAVRR